jgi:hypothetical protein
MAVRFWIRLIKLKNEAHVITAGKTPAPFLNRRETSRTVQPHAAGRQPVPFREEYSAGLFSLRRMGQHTTQISPFSMVKFTIVQPSIRISPIVYIFLTTRGTPQTALRSVHHQMQSFHISIFIFYGF